jgi:hypothetical protein
MKGSRLFDHAGVKTVYGTNTSQRGPISKFPKIGKDEVSVQRKK